MTLGENITRLRTQKDWSQGDLADALGISRQSISNGRPTPRSPNWKSS